MTRPRRLYSTEDGKFYYIIDGKKKFVKVPEGISKKQIAQINIKNIVNAPIRKRVKRRRKRIVPSYGAKVGNVLQKAATGGLPLYFFQPKKEIPTIEQMAKNASDTTVDKLSKAILKLLPSSTKIEPTITPPKSTPKPTSTLEGYDDIIVRGIKNVAEMDNIWTNQTTDGYDFAPNRQAYGTYLNRILNTFEDISEDKKKELFKKYKANKELEKTYFETLGDWIETLSDSTSSTSVLTTPSSTPKMSPLVDIEDVSESGKKIGEIQVPIVMRGVFGRFKEDQFQGVAKSKQDIPIRGVKNKNEEDDGGVAESKEEPITGGGVDDGLYNDEIENVIKKRIKNYVPVIASDKINELTKYVGKGDKRFGFVVNTNPSTSDGSGEDGYRTGHWRSVYINNEDDYPSVEYFDPLSEGKMPSDLVSICRKIAMKMNPSTMFKYKQNMLQRQSKLSSNCGWHSVKFLDDRFNGVPWSEATGYDDYMAQQNAVADDSRDGEKDISKYIKKYSSFI